MVASTPSPAETFLQEAAELLDDLEAALLDLEHDPLNSELINRAFRALHTIKGSGAMFGFDAVAEFTHHVEGAFQKVRDGQQSISSRLIAATLEAEDHIRDLLAHNNDVERGERLTQTFLSLMAGGVVATSAPERPAVATNGANADGTDGDGQPRRWHIRCRLAPQTMAFGTNPLVLLDDLRALGECVVVALPDGIPTLDHMDPLCCYMEWDIFLSTAHPKTAIEDVFLFVMDDSEISITPLDDKTVSPLLGEILIARGDVPREVVEETVAQQRPLGQMLVKAGAVSPERVVSALVQQHHETRKPAATPASAPAAPDSGHGSVRVQAERLDSLMDQVGELVIAQARLRQLAAGSDDILLRAISEDIERLSADLR
ncbi:Hpt domain-containing protein, partial [Insolitispirillum peregrinum]